MKAPCYGCEKREVGCHATCQATRNFKQKTKK